MRILLAHNSTYYPASGGGDKSNRLLMEALAARGHEVRVVTRVERFGDEGHASLLNELRKRGVVPESNPASVTFTLSGVEVHALTRSPQLRTFFQEQVRTFDPDVIVTSTDDPAQILFEPSIKAPRARVVYLVRATIAVPFGPDSSSVSSERTENLRLADGVVGVSHYVASYVRQWSGMDAVHVPISLLEPDSSFPNLGRFESPYISMVNPCAVKGIDIFVQLAGRLPHLKFAAIPAWGTSAADMDALRARPNITLLAHMDNIDGLFEQTRVMLVPSVWAEARSRVVLEAMSRGVPVIASDVGGLHEAKLGVPYLLRVNPIVKYKPSLDESLVPVAEVPPQDVAPWEKALHQLATDRGHWEDLSAASRKAALAYASTLTAEPFERVLEDLLRKPKRGGSLSAAKPAMSDEKRRLLALRIKKRASAQSSSNAWLPGVEIASPEKLRLFCFPWAGGGPMGYRAWKDALADVAEVVPVRLPGRESRATETPVEDMDELVAALLNALREHSSVPFAFFGHSMGAGIAFELARALRRESLPLPEVLIVSGARAPRYRLNLKPGPEPNLRDFIEDLRRLEGFPPSILSNPEMMKLALPALLSDARLYRNYVYTPGEPLPVPFVAMGGDADPNVTAEHIDAWREHTSAAFHRHEFSGGHFFLESSRGPVIEAVREALNRA